MTVWQWYWACWFTLTVGLFLPVELYALFTGHPENTLSWSVWDLEGFIPGSHTTWTWSHWLVGGFFFVLCLWLAVHFAFGWLR
jgi:hypothetical protein